MADALRVKVSAKQSLEDAISRFNFTPLQVQQIGSASINRSLPTVRTSVTRRLAGVLNLRQRDIRASISIQRASYDRLQGSVTVSRKPIPLIDFIGTRQDPEGVSVQVRKDGPRETLKGTFIARMKSGHEGVFERQFKGGAGAYGTKRVGRLPIVERFGLTLTGYLTHAPDVVAEEQANAGEVLQKNLTSQINRRLAQFRK